MHWSCKRVGIVGKITFRVWQDRVNSRMGELDMMISGDHSYESSKVEELFLFSTFSGTTQPMFEVPWDDTWQLPRHSYSTLKNLILFFFWEYSSPCGVCKCMTTKSKFTLMKVTFQTFNSQVTKVRLKCKSCNLSVLSVLSVLCVLAEWCQY